MNSGLRTVRTGVGEHGAHIYIYICTLDVVADPGKKRDCCKLTFDWGANVSRNLRCPEMARTVGL